MKRASAARPQNTGINVAAIVRRAGKNYLGKKGSKYNNVRFVADGFRWDSKREYERWQELRAMEAAGEIADLERQVRFPLYARNGTLACHIVVDFVYLSGSTNVIEDAKGFGTPLYRLKKRLFEGQYGVPIQEV